jgi:hypothetical protein
MGYPCRLCSTNLKGRENKMAKETTGMNLTLQVKEQALRLTVQSL